MREVLMRLGLLGLVLAATLSGCGDDQEQTSPTPTTSAEPSSPPLPCDPGGGFPRDRSGCPDPDPETGWLSRGQDDHLRLRPFRTLGNDAEGKAYAEQRGVEFPFPNDYYDATDGQAHRLDLDSATVCSGIILVGYREPLEDHPVSCADLVRVAADQRIPVAVWRDDGRAIQVSELYRP